MKPVIFMVVLTTASVGLLGCSSITVQEYVANTPTLIPKTFFNGRLCADGIVKDYRGRVTRHFNARILASWDSAGIGTLDEVFQFADRHLGDYEKRIWTLVPDRDGAYMATANDVVEPARMTFAGNSLHMNYLLNYGADDDQITLRMDDWMFLVNEKTIVNETRMSKWGLTLGHVLLTIRKAHPADLCLAGGSAAAATERVSM